MKFLFFWMACAFSVSAQTVQFRNLNSNQFGIGAFTASIKRSAITTNGIVFGTQTNYTATPDPTVYIRVVVPPTNAVAGQPLYMEWYSMTQQTTNFQFIYHKGWNAGPAGLLDTNFQGYQQSKEMHWDPFYPSNVKQIEVYDTFYPRSNGVPSRVASQTLRDDYTQLAFNISSVIFAAPTQTIVPLKFEFDGDGVGIGVHGRLGVTTNGAGLGTIDAFKWITFTKPAGTPGSSGVYMGNDWANELGVRPAFAIGNISTPVSMQVFGFTNWSLSATVLGVQNIFATNDISALTFTDRSHSPEDKAAAWEIVNSHKVRNGRVDHSVLSTKASSGDKSSRNLSMVVSAQSMALQDLNSKLNIIYGLLAGAALIGIGIAAILIKK